MTLALVAFMAWRHNVRNKAYFYWGTGFLLSGVGFAMAALRGQIPAILSIEIANTIALSGQSAWVAGYLALDRRKLEWWALLPPLVWLGGVFLPWVNDDYTNRVILFNLASAAGATALAMAVCMAGKQNEGSRGKLGAIFVIQGVLCFGTALAMAILGPTDAEAVNFAGSAAMATGFLLILACALTCLVIMERSEKYLRMLSLTDSLTSVLNRRGLFGRFDAIRERAFNSNRQVAVLLFDLDHFKRVNDRFGHDVGDEALRSFARVGRQVIRRGDLLGRFGGEEFLLVLPGATPAAAQLLFDRLLGALRATQVTGLPEGETLSFSMGVAAWRPEVSEDQLLREADEALYRAKAAGRARMEAASETGARRAGPSGPPGEEPGSESGRERLAEVR